MRKYFLVVLLLVVTIMISGQQGCDRTGDGEVGEGPYVGGNDGLEIAFLDDAPSLSGNFQGIAIPLEVELTNYGETEIPSGSAVVNLIGTIMGGAFTLSDTDGTVSNLGIIDKIRDSSDISDSDFVNLGTAILKDSEPIGPSWSPNVRSQVCYPYSTSLQIDDLCIPGSRSETGVVECEIDSAENLIDRGDVSGAPITVSNLVEGRTGDGIRVTLDIENTGGGTVITNTCDNAVNVPLENRDLVTVDVPSGYECLFSDGTSGVTGTVKLRSNKGRLRCTNQIGGTGRAYLDRLVATLTYKYVETTSKAITIENEYS